MVAGMQASSEAKKTGAFPDWVLLDPLGRIYCYDDKAAAAAAVEDDATAVAFDTTNGQSGYLSFTLRSSPSVSYLKLHWPYGIPKSMSSDFLPASKVVSADGPLVLLRIYANESPYCGSPDMFVYRAGTSSPPSLRRLPVCTIKSQGVDIKKSFFVDEGDFGILCRGGGDHQDDDDDYVVADLMVSLKEGGDRSGIIPSPMIANLCFFSSQAGEWMMKEMVAPQPQGQGEFPVFWYCDSVLPFAGRFLCWVDYYNGVLLADLSDDTSPVLCYVPLPGKQYPDEAKIERGWPEAFRSVCVSQEKMHFVHIDSEIANPFQQSDETITVWTLNTTTTDRRFIWEMQSVINLNVLWADPCFQALDLPHHPPEFPVVDKDDPSSLCCVLNDNFYGNGKVWIIKFDVKNGLFQSCAPFINEQDALPSDVLRMGDVGCYMYISLFSSDFSKHLNKQPGILVS